jgi:hypothetical protein
MLKVAIILSLLLVCIPSIQATNVTITGSEGLEMMLGDNLVTLNGTAIVLDASGDLVEVATFGQDLNKTIYTINGHQYPIFGYVILTAYKQAIPIFKEMLPVEDAIDYGVMMESNTICIGTSPDAYGWYPNIPFEESIS